MVHNIRHIKIVKNLAFLFFGIIFPAFMLGSSILNLHTTSSRLYQINDKSSVFEEIKQFKSTIKESNDYAMFSMMYLEKQTHDSLVLKQIMKITTMYIGYAVLSIGVMMIFLGIETKEQSDIDGNFLGLTFNIKSGSAGIIIFLFGAIMTILPGAINNKYQTPDIPKFSSSSLDYSSISKQVTLIYKFCQQQPVDQKDDCFHKAITKSYGG